MLVKESILSRIEILSSVAKSTAAIFLYVSIMTMWYPLNGVSNRTDYPPALGMNARIPLWLSTKYARSSHQCKLPVAERLNETSTRHKSQRLCPQQNCINKRDISLNTGRYKRCFSIESFRLSIITNAKFWSIFRKTLLDFLFPNYFRSTL